MIISEGRWAMNKEQVITGSIGRVQCLIVESSPQHADNEYRQNWFIAPLNVLMKLVSGVIKGDDWSM